MMRTVAAAALALLSFCVAAEQRPYTIHDQVRLERISDPRLSPDGRWLSYQLRTTDYAANRGRSSIWLMPADGSAPARRLTAADTSSGSARWSADGRGLFFLSTRSGSNQLWWLDLRGGEAVQVSDFPLDVSAYLPSPDGHRLAISLEVFPDCGADLSCTRKRLDAQGASQATGRLYHKLFVRHWDTWKNGTRAQLFLADLDENRRAKPQLRLLSQGIDGDVPSKPFGDDSEIAFAADGSELVFAARMAGTSEPWSTNFDLWRVRIAEPETVPENLTRDNPAWDASPRYSPDGEWLAYLAMRRPGFEADRFAIRLRNLRTGATRELAPHWDRSPSSIAWSSDGKTLYANAYDIGQKPLFAIDVATSEVRRLTGEGTVGNFTVGGNALVIQLETLAQPVALYRLAPDAAPVLLERRNEERLAGIRFAEYEQFSFKGARGDRVYGYVMKPWNLQPGHKYPVAFIIHGGPQGSMGNSFHYRWNPQTYAGQGYAVVFIDFHGSVGYGQAFTDSISKSWGDLPLEDLQKGWRHALQQYDFLDGERACALGASYGGFMVNWIAGRWPDGFRCLVNHDGVFDQRMMYYTTEELWFPEWEHGGPAYANPKAYEKFNPVRYVQRWRTPMLVIHGALDFRLPLEQGLATFTALQRRGIPSQFLYFPDENHWVLKPHNSVQWHETVEAWLQRWLQP